MQAPDILILILLLLRFMALVFVLVMVAYIVAGIREFRKIPGSHIPARLDSLHWEGSPVNIKKIGLSSMFFFIGLAGSFGMMAIADIIIKQHLWNYLTFTAYLGASALCVCLVVFGFGRFQLLGGVLGYIFALQLVRWLPGLFLNGTDEFPH